MSTTIYPKFYVEFDVDSTNDRLDVEVDGDIHLCTISRGQHDIISFLDELKSQMFVRTSSTFNYTIDSVGKVTWTSASGLQWRWLVTSGSSPTTSANARAIMGYAGGETPLGTSHTSSYQHKYGWYGNHEENSGKVVPLPPASMVGPMYEAPNTTMTTTISGRSHVRWFGNLKFIEFEFSYVPVSKMIISERPFGNSNRSFEEFWLQASQGYKVIFFENASSPTSSEWLLHPDSMSEFEYEIVNTSPALYSYEFKLREWKD